MCLDEDISLLEWKSKNAPFSHSLYISVHGLVAGHKNEKVAWGGEGKDMRNQASQPPHT